MPTVVISFDRPESVLRTSVDMGGISLTLPMAVVLPAPVVPLKSILCSAIGLLIDRHCPVALHFFHCINREDVYFLTVVQFFEVFEVLMPSPARMRSSSPGFAKASALLVRLSSSWGSGVRIGTETATVV